MTLAGYESLPGTALPPGTITIPLAECAALGQVLGSPAAEADLHPLHAYVAMQRGIGAEIADLCAYADFQMEDGPMMGSLDLEIFAPMRADTEYAVEGELIDLVRKEGSRFVFDLLTFRERLMNSEGTTIAQTTNTFVLPRQHAKEEQ